MEGEREPQQVLLWPHTPCNNSNYSYYLKCPMKTEELHEQDEQTDGGLLNYEWAVICSQSSCLGAGTWVGKEPALFTCLVYLLSVLSALEIPSPCPPHSFWTLMFNLTQRSLRRHNRGLLLAGWHGGNWNVRVFSHLSKKGKNLKWHFISNELWTVYFVPKGTTTKLGF